MTGSLFRLLDDEWIRYINGTINNPEGYRLTSFISFHEIQIKIVLLKIIG